MATMGTQSLRIERKEPCINRYRNLISFMMNLNCTISLHDVHGKEHSTDDLEMTMHKLITTDQKCFIRGEGDHGLLIKVEILQQ